MNELVETVDGIANSQSLCACDVVRLAVVILWHRLVVIGAEQLLVVLFEVRKEVSEENCHQIGNFLFDWNIRQ